VNKRSIRIRELLLQEVSRALGNVKDPGVAGFVTVTDLVLAGDMKSARVFFSVLGTADDRRKTQRALDRAEGFVRREMYGRLRLKVIPRLTFVFDDTPESAHRFETLLDRIKTDDSGAAQEPASDGAYPSRLDSVASRSAKRSRKRRK